MKKLTRFMKRCKIILPITILCLLLLSSLTACKESNRDVDHIDNNKNNDTNQVISQGAQKHNPLWDQVLTKELLQKAYPNKEIVTWVYNDLVNISSKINILINDMLVEKGYDFVYLFEGIPDSSYEKTINSKITDGASPDIICAGIGAAGTLQGTMRAYKNNWLEELDDYLSTEEGSTLKAAFPENIWKSFQVLGKIYGISGALPVATNYTYYVNKDLADKYDISPEELSHLSPEKLGPILKKVYQGEASDNFTALIPRNSDTIDSFIPVFDYYNNHCSAIVIDPDNPDQKVINLFKVKNAVRFFEAFSDYDKKGYINFNSKTTNFFIAMDFNDMFRQTEENIIKNFNQKYPDCVNLQAVDYAPYYLTTAMNSITGVCRSSDRKETALKALTVSVTDREISNLLLYGVEGDDYLLDNNKIKTEKNSNFTSLYFGNPMITTPLTYEPDNKKDIIEDKLHKMLTPWSLGIVNYVDLTDLSGELNKLNAIVSEYKCLFQGNYKDVDETLKILNKKLKKAGIEKVLTEMNRRYEKSISN